MDVTKRRTLIEEEVIRAGEVSFVALAERFDVSEMTIRRDIEALQSMGVVRRVSGGAIALAGTAFEPSYGLRAGRAAGSKAQIGERIAALLHPGETVVLDSGSTVLAVAQAIRGLNLGLTVITPSIGVATALADEPGTQVLLTGGVVRPGELSLIGSDAELMMARYNCDTYVAGVAGVDAVRGLTEYHPQEASVKEAAVRASRRVIVGVDQEKLGRVHLVNVAPLHAVAALVSDAPSTHPTLEAATARGVDVYTVAPAAGAETSIQRLAGDSA
ncbi:MAG: DeoR/GlpR transcriptional regulator [Microbacterium sp.]|uniref:DeoR/GlpR family DNA-binding transcription regulator n=1 Tax=Microbacterium sp. TaxID=51671 RepID=UPI000DAF531E|nr:DeoR/GlpR family DNA-binding transcription regulator [Microbacterium sp.]PZU39901.1 MAG: DeoR/GlpR transcriptional regulator [Microbacterium sp.]